MTQGERVKAIRKELNLTLEKFGDRLGVGKTAISKIEKGENKLTALMSNAICHEFRVNREYLDSGIGEMFSIVPKDAIDDLCDQYGLDEFDRVLMHEYFELDAESRKALKDYIRLFMKRPGNVNNQPATVDNPDEEKMA